jgi:hypothetical protein
MTYLIHNQKKQNILVLDDVFTVCQFDRKAKIDLNSFDHKGFFSVTFTDEEISIVTKEDLGTNCSKIEKNWKCLKIKGQLDFNLIGVIHNILDVLMKAEVSLFVISTYNTDYILVRENMLHKALEALKNNGYDIEFASVELAWQNLRH